MFCPDNDNTNFVANVTKIIEILKKTLSKEQLPRHIPAIFLRRHRISFERVVATELSHRQKIRLDDCRGPLILFDHIT